MLSHLDRRVRTPSGVSLRAMACVVVLAAAVGWFVADPRFVRAGLAIAMCLLIAGIGFKSPQRLVVWLMLWLLALGLVRRLLSGDRIGGLVDPLLLIEPVALAVLVLVASSVGAFRSRTRLANSVLVLQLILFASVLNPLQGGIVAGMAGALLVPVPMLAFWIGRGLCTDDTMRRVVRVIAVGVLVAAAYGLYQTFVGFPSWDAAWIRDFGYVALNVNKVTRSFSTFSSASEYAIICGVGLVIWLAPARRLLLRPHAVLALVLIGVALFLISSRGAIVIALLAVAFVVAAGWRFSLGWTAVFGLLALAALPTVVGWLAPTQFASDGSDALIAHQVQGLTDPFNEDTSTLGTHASLVGGGLGSALTSPLGSGVGSVTLAGAKFGGTVAGTEADPSNIAVAVGIPGLVAFALVTLLAFRRAHALALARADRLSLIALGILVATFLQWTNGGQYATCWLVWLTIGWIDRASTAEEAADLVGDPS